MILLSTIINEFKHGFLAQYKNWWDKNHDTRINIFLNNL
jgi:hypothetical protein